MPLSKVADAAGTPLYVYSSALLRARFRAIDAAFGTYPHALHYALKANSALAIARRVVPETSSAEMRHAAAKVLTLQPVAEIERLLNESFATASK